MITERYFLSKELLTKAINDAKSGTGTVCYDRKYKASFQPATRITHFGVLTAITRKGFISRQALKQGLSLKEQTKLPIPPSDACKFIGTIPIKTGEVPLKVKRCSKIFAFWVESGYCPKPIKALPNPTNYFMLSGSWQSNFNHLLDMAKSGSQRHTWSSLSPILDYVHLLKVPLLSAPNINDLDYVRVSPNTYPGLVTSHICKISNKGRIPGKKTCLPAALLTARRIWGRISKEGLHDRTIYVCGGREKLSKIGDKITDYKDAKSRLVLMPEFPSQLVNMAWQQRFQDEYMINEGPIFIGRGMSHNGWVAHYDRFKDCKTLFEGDWKEFDSSISEELLVLAFQIIRMSFPGTQEVDNFFNFFVSSFVHKNILTPGGFAYRISRGIPSGSCWTSMIGSIVNWIVWVDVISNYPGFTKRNIDLNEVVFTLSGDDFLIGFKQEFKLNIPQLKRWILKRHGLLLKEGCGMRVLVSDDHNIVASFLKTSLTPHGPSVKIEDFYEQIVIPRTSLKNKFLYIQYLVERLRSPPGCKIVSETLSSLFTFYTLLLAHIRERCVDADNQIRLFESGFEYSDEFASALSDFINSKPDHRVIKEENDTWTRWIESNWMKVYMNRIGEATNFGPNKVTGVDPEIQDKLALGRSSHQDSDMLYSGAYAY